MMCRKRLQPCRVVDDMRHKDINDMIMSGLTVSEVQSIISKNTCLQLEALTKLSYYKKC